MSLRERLNASVPPTQEKKPGDFLAAKLDEIADDLQSSVQLRQFRAMKNLLSLQHQFTHCKWDDLTLTLVC